MQELELCREVLKNFSLKHVHCSAENGTIEFGLHTISPTEIEVPRIGGIRIVPGWEVSVITHSYDAEGMLYDVDVNPVEKSHVPGSIAHCNARRGEEGVRTPDGNARHIFRLSVGENRSKTRATSDGKSDMRRYHR